jgi:hypothetical protein
MHQQVKGSSGEIFIKDASYEHQGGQAESMTDSHQHTIEGKTL